MNKKNNVQLVLLLLVIALGIGYAYINSDLNINGTAKIKNANWDVHWANVQVSSGSVTGENVVTEPTIDSAETTVAYSVVLPTPGDYYEFTVDAVNAGVIDAMIDTIDSKLNGATITTLPDYLEYTVTYGDGITLQPNHELKANTTETYKVKIKYRDDIELTQIPASDQTLSLQFTVTYRQATENSKPAVNPVSFAEDDWATIVAAVKKGKTENYNVGDTKEINMGTLGTQTLRISNMSTPDVCSAEGFSQTACGFVLEFVDIITTHRMNPYIYGDTTTIGVNNKGGWEYSDMRAFLNGTTYAYESIDYSNTGIYSSLPEVLKNAIIDTTVVSGHGSNDSSNFTSTDKIYLVSAVELWGDNDYSSIDTATNLSRQFDYYNDIGIDSNHHINAQKKISGTTSSHTYWWLRSAEATSYGFVRVVGDGMRSTATPSRDHGVSPAFRIG